MTTEALTAIMIVAGCVFAFASVLYGVFRKFTQMSWLSYQIPLVFLVVVLLRWLPEDTAPSLRLFLGLAIAAGATVLILGGGALLRKAMLKKRMPAHGAWRFLDRLLGGITALWDYIMILLVLGSVVLSFFAYVYDPLPDVFGAVFELGIWKDFFAYHALDLLLVTLIVFAIRGGWRVGFGRFVVIVLMLALTLGSLVLALYLSIGVPFFSNMVAGASPVGRVAGIAVIGFLLFLLFFTLSCVAGYFMVKLLRLIRYDYFWGTIDAFAGCALSLIFSVVVISLIYAGFVAASGGALSAAVHDLIARLGENANSVELAMQPFLEGLKNFENMLLSCEEWLKSAPLSAAFFSNPIFPG